QWQPTVLPSQPGSWRPLAVSADGKLLAAGGTKGIEIWDLETRKVRTTLTGYVGELESVAFSPDGILLASGGHDGAVRLWDLNTNQGVALGPNRPGWATSVAFSPDGKQLVSGHTTEDRKRPNTDRMRDGEVNLWNVAQRKHERLLLQYKDGGVLCLAC